MRRSLLLVAALCLTPADAPTPDDFRFDRYEALVVDVHDGDTITVIPARPRRIRLLGIDSPEVRSNAHGKADAVEGPRSRDALKAFLAGGKVYVREGGQTFGRQLGRVYVERDGKLVDASDWMITNKYAVPYMTD